MILRLHAINEGMGTLELISLSHLQHMFAFQSRVYRAIISLDLRLVPGDNCVAMGGFMKPCNV